jgi:predicted O-methyltransferase YrrM
MRLSSAATVACLIVCSVAQGQQPAEKERPAVEDAKVKAFLEARRGTWHDLNVPESDGKLLHDLVVKNGYKDILEIGTSTGHSTIWLAWAASKTGGKVTTLEIDADRQKQAIANVKEAGLADYVDFRLGDAHKLVKELKGPFDFVFSDADKDWYKQYFIDVYPKLKVGGCFTAHNVSMRGAGIREFLDYLKTVPGLETTIDNSSRSGVSISYKRKAAEAEKEGAKGPGSSQSTSTSAEPAAWQTIFNGKDLTGWDGDPRLWSVKDGAIHGETTPENAAQGNTFLIWKGGRTKDFKLSLSFRCTATNNSGIQYRSKHITEGSPRNPWVVRGYQHEIRNEVELPSVAGFIYEEGGKRGRMCLVGEKAVWGEDGKKTVTDTLIDGDGYRKLFKLDDWNDVLIVAQGPHLQHYLNGKLILDCTDNHPELALREGILALQLHAGKPMWAEFKDIRIQQLPEEGR